MQACRGPERSSSDEQASAARRTGCVARALLLRPSCLLSTHDRGSHEIAKPRIRRTDNCVRKMQFALCIVCATETNRNRNRNIIWQMAVKRVLCVWVCVRECAHHSWTSFALSSSFSSSYSLPNSNVWYASISTAFLASSRSVNALSSAAYFSASATILSISAEERRPLEFVITCTAKPRHSFGTGNLARRQGGEELTTEFSAPVTLSHAETFRIPLVSSSMDISTFACPRFARSIPITKKQRHSPVDCRGTLLLCY